jgi:hypothetical protein
MPSSFSESRSSSYTDARELVHRVISHYVECVSLPSVSTFTTTEDGTAKSQKTLQPGSVACHYKCDVEAITERILKDKPAPQKAWWEIAAGETPKGLAEVHLVQKLQKAYRAIDPWKYFRPSLRRGSVESQQRRATA